MESQQFLDDPYGQQQFLDDTYSQQNIDINKNGVFLFAGSFLALAGLVGLWRNIDNVKSTLASIKEHFKRNKEDKKEDKKEEQKDTKKPTIHDLLFKSAKEGATAESIQAIIKAFSDEESSSHMRDSEVVKSMVSLRKFSGILPSELTSNNVTELVKSISTLREKLVDRGFDNIEIVHLADAYAILTKASLTIADLNKAHALLDNVNQVALHADINTLMTHLTTMTGLLTTFETSASSDATEKLGRLNVIASDVTVGLALRKSIKETLDTEIKQKDIKTTGDNPLVSLNEGDVNSFATYFAIPGVRNNTSAHALSHAHIDNSTSGQNKTHAHALKNKILNLSQEEIAQRIIANVISNNDVMQKLLIKQTTAILKEIPMLKTQQQKNAAQPKNTVNNVDTVLTRINDAYLGLTTANNAAVTEGEVSLLDRLRTSVEGYILEESQRVAENTTSHQHYQNVRNAYYALRANPEFNKRHGNNVNRDDAAAIGTKKQMIELCGLISLYSESNKSA